MGYLKIPNLYKDQDILLFKECYALQKIHGTSAHLSYCQGMMEHDKIDTPDSIHFFSGGSHHERFVKLFDQDDLLEKFREIGRKITVYGEAYGGRLQKMSETYGQHLKFIVFDVKIDDTWVSVSHAASLAKELGLEFVSYRVVSTDLESLNAERDRPSEQARRNGMGEHKEEGVVLRPLIEVTKNNGARIIAKHKRDDFRETKTPRVVSSEELRILSDAKEVAEEWVTPMRVAHVLDKIEDPCMEKMREVMGAMVIDIEVEGEGEIEWSKAVRKAIGKKTAEMVKQYFQDKLKEQK